MGYWSGLAEGYSAPDKLLETIEVNGLTVKIYKGIDFYAQIGNETSFGESLQDVRDKIPDLVNRHQKSLEFQKNVYQKIAPTLVRIAMEKNVPVVITKDFSNDLIEKQVRLLVDADWYYKGTSVMALINKQKFYCSVKDGKTLEDLEDLLNFESLSAELKALKSKPQTAKVKHKVEQLQERLKNVDSARYWNSL